MDIQTLLAQADRFVSRLVPFKNEHLDTIIDTLKLKPTYNNQSNGELVKMMFPSLDILSLIGKQKACLQTVAITSDGALYFTSTNVKCPEGYIWLFERGCIYSDDSTKTKVSAWKLYINANPVMSFGTAFEGIASASVERLDIDLPLNHIIYPGQQFGCYVDWTANTNVNLSLLVREVKVS